MALFVPRRAVSGSLAARASFPLESAGRRQRRQFLGHRHRGVVFRHQVEAQLKQKEEMGDVLHYIDFHQLQIENKQCVAHVISYKLTYTHAPPILLLRESHTHTRARGGRAPVVAPSWRGSRSGTSNVIECKV